MKIGFSLSRCMRDIFEGKVDMDDVLVIITRTNIDPGNDDHWKEIWEGYLYGGYSSPEWAGLEEHEEEMRDILESLFQRGKFHQPRKFGSHPYRLPYNWLETFAPEDEVAKNPAAEKAWNNYKLIAGLS